VLFPDLANYHPGSTKWEQRFRNAELRIGNDDGAVRGLYTMMRHSTWPRASRVHRHTALFRIVQIQALHALSIYRRYGRVPPETAIVNQIEHDARDRDYALPALLCGALATRDEGLAMLVRRAEPTMLVIGMKATRSIRSRSFARDSSER
jgi:hypothetical protein